MFQQEPDLHDERRKNTKLVKMGDFEGFKFGLEGPMHTLTCVNHQTAKYYSKNPWTRGLHLIEYPIEYRYGKGDNSRFGTECPCPFSDLRVVVEVSVTDGIVDETDLVPLESFNPVVEDHDCMAECQGFDVEGDK